MHIHTHTHLNFFERKYFENSILIADTVKKPMLSKTIQSTVLQRGLLLREMHNIYLAPALCCCSRISRTPSPHKSFSESPEGMDSQTGSLITQKAACLCLLSFSGPLWGDLMRHPCPSAPSGQLVVARIIGPASPQGPASPTRGLASRCFQGSWLHHSALPSFSPCWAHVLQALPEPF